MIPRWYVNLKCSCPIYEAIINNVWLVSLINQATTCFIYISLKPFLFCDPLYVQRLK
jgi:hypothetical protein